MWTNQATGKRGCAGGIAENRFRTNRRSTTIMNEVKMKLFDQFFYPRSLAVIGVSADENAFGTLYLRALLNLDLRVSFIP